MLYVGLKCLEFFLGPMDMKMAEAKQAEQRKAQIINHSKKNKIGGPDSWLSLVHYSKAQYSVVQKNGPIFCYDKGQNSHTAKCNHQLTNTNGPECNFMASLWFWSSYVIRIRIKFEDEPAINSNGDDEAKICRIGLAIWVWMSTCNSWSDDAFLLILDVGCYVDASFVDFLSILFWLIY